MKQTIRLTESELKNMIAKSVRKALTEGRIPQYEQPVFIGCTSEADADAKVEIGYSSYYSSLFYVGECGTDGYAALAAVVEYLVDNGIIDHYAYDEEERESYAEEDFVEVEGYYLPSWMIHIEQIVGNHGERPTMNESRISSIVAETIRKVINS